MKQRPTGTVARLLASNPVAIAIPMIIGFYWRRLINAYMAKALNAPGIYLGPGCRVLGARFITLGRGVYAPRNLWLQAVTAYHSQFFTPSIAIGDHTCFGESAHISAIEKIVIGKYGLIGGKSYIADHNHGMYNGENQSRPEEPPADRVLGGGGPVIIGDNVWIGDNSVILGPATIGSGCIIGANSIVRGVIPPNCIVAGAPARIIKTFNPQTGRWERAQAQVAS